MAGDSPVLLIGATGMLGRPVARRLVEEGLACRALVRDPARARDLLPERLELVVGDLRDGESLRRAVEGCRAVYLNLAAPMRRKPPVFDPELHGTRAVLEAVRAAGSTVEQVLRISSAGVEGAADRWWAARHKRDADRLLMESGSDWTIFRPTWFSESLATMKVGRVMMSIPLGETRLRWLAGDDYGRQVAAALGRPAARNRVYLPQGPESLTIPEAVNRFAKACAKRPMVLPFPAFSTSALGLLSGKAAYLARLLDMTRREFAESDRSEAATDLPHPTMTVEDYVAYMERTGDEPTK